MSLTKNPQDANQPGLVQLDATVPASQGILPPLEAVPSLSLLSQPSMDLPWETLSAMIQGRSSIDLTAMPVYNRDEAFSLVYNYGFDLSLPEDVAEMKAYFTEAVDFIEKRFLSPSVDWAGFGELPPPASSIPAEVKDSCDVLDLMLLAAQKENPLRPWACALLKVMHTLVYIQNSPLYKHHAQASETILSRFQNVMHEESDGTITLQGLNGRSLNLYAFEAKQNKPRESILIKLLCKKENVAENVWDLVGVRLITHHPAEAILAVDILREQKVLLFPNVIPSRSRNTLLDFAHFRGLYEQKLSQYQLGQCSLDEMQKIFQTSQFIIPEETHANQNPLSSPQYRSLHITCRQLLRIKQPDGFSETRFAFPYEIQIMDEESYRNSKIGLGAHDSYKQRQLIAARRRVLGSLVKA